MNNTFFNISNKIVNTTGDKTNTTRVVTVANGNHLPFVFLGLLSCLIISANSLVIALVYKNKQLRTLTNLCLVCLALSDLLSGLVAIPLIFACNLTVMPNRIAFCIAMDLASRFIAISTILHLLIVTFERYVMIIYPMHYFRIITKHRMVAALVFIWAFSLTVSLIQLIWISLDSNQTENENEQHSSTIQYNDVIYSYSCFVGLVTLPLILLAVAYGRIFLILRAQLERIRRQLSHIRRSRGAARQKRGQKRAVTILGSMILAFILGWFSYFLTSILSDEDVVTDFPPAVNVILLFMRFGTSLVNPLLYTLFKEDFRKVLKSLVYKNPQNPLVEIPLNSNAGSTVRSD